LNAGPGKNLSIKGTDGTQDVSVTNGAGQKVNVNLGDGDDSLSLTNGGGRKKLTVNLGAGDDSLSLTNVLGGDLVFKANGGSGTDSFLLFPGDSSSVKTKGFEIFT
ncbi:MAG: hypothetical protein AB8G99_27125, partial [Planctomycetaceae bacterium]